MNQLEGVKNFWKGRFLIDKKYGSALLDTNRGGHPWWHTHHSFSHQTHNLLSGKSHTAIQYNSNIIISSSRSLVQEIVKSYNISVQLGITPWWHFCLYIYTISIGNKVNLQIEHLQHVFLHKNQFIFAIKVVNLGNQKISYFIIKHNNLLIIFEYAIGNRLNCIVLLFS